MNNRFNREFDELHSLEETCKEFFPDFEERNIRNYFESLPQQTGYIETGDILIRRQFGHHEPAWYGIVEAIQDNNAQVLTAKGRKQVPLNKVPGKSGDWELKVLKPDGKQNGPSQISEPVVVSILNKKDAHITVDGEPGPELKPLSLLLAEDVGNPATPNWITDDAEKPDPGIENKALELNRQFWRLYNMEEIEPIVAISAVQTPNLFANKVREGQLVFVRMNYGINAVRIIADGMFGYRTLILLAIIAGDPEYKKNYELRHELAGLGFNMKSLSGIKAREAIKRAWTVIAPLNILKVFQLKVPARMHVEFLQSTQVKERWGMESISKESMERLLNDMLFQGAPPDWFKSDTDQKIRLSILKNSYTEDDTFDVTAALVFAKRDFLHNLWDQQVFFNEKIKNTPANHKRLWRVLTRDSAYNKEILEAAGISAKDLGIDKMPRWNQITGILVQYILPIKKVDIDRALLKFQTDMTSIVEKLRELLDADERRYIKANRIEQFLIGLPVNTTFGEVFFDEVDKKLGDTQKNISGVEEMITKIEDLSHVAVFQLMVRLSVGGKYEKHPALVRLNNSLEALKKVVSLTITIYPEQKE